MQDICHFFIVCSFLKLNYLATGNCPSERFTLIAGAKELDDFRIEGRAGFNFEVLEGGDTRHLSSVCLSCSGCYSGDSSESENELLEF